MKKINNTDKIVAGSNLGAFACGIAIVGMVGLSGGALALAGLGFLLTCMEPTFD